MKKLLTLTGIGAVLALLAACQTTGTGDVMAQKEALLTQSGFKVTTVTTPKQQQAISGLTQGRVTAAKYNGKLYYVFPTATKDKIYVGRQKQFNTYKQALATAYASDPASQTAAEQGQAQMAGQLSDADARGRRTRTHRSSAVRWLWSDGRERSGRLVKEGQNKRGQQSVGCCSRWSRTKKTKGRM